MEAQVQSEVKLDDGKVSQKNAVYNYVTEALASNGAVKDEGQKLKDLVSKDVRKVVRQRLFNSVRSGQIKTKEPMDDSKLKKYCSGLIGNWLKKDPRFN